MTGHASLCWWEVVVSALWEWGWEEKDAGADKSSVNGQGEKDETKLMEEMEGKTVQYNRRRLLA